MHSKTRSAQVLLSKTSNFDTYWNKIPDVLDTTMLEQVESITWTTDGRKPYVSNECVHQKTNAYYAQLAARQHRYTTYGIHGEQSCTDEWRWYVPNLRDMPKLIIDEDQYPWRRQDAITRVMAAGEHTTLDVPLFLIELRDVREFGRNLSDLKRYIGALGKRGLSAAELGTMSIKQVCDAKLAYSFGVRPLLSDTPKLVEALNKAELEVRPLKKAGDTVRAGFTIQPNTILREYEGSDFTLTRRPVSSDMGLSVYNSLDPLGPGMTVPYVRPSRQYQVPYHKYVCYGRLAKAPFGNLASRQRFNMMQNLGGLSTFYELTKFSFVLDYFANVGGLIQDLEERMKAVSLQVEFAEGIWESHEQAVTTVVPTYTFLGSDRSLLGTSGWTHFWEDTLKYRWDGWTKVAGDMLYKREPLSDLIPLLAINTSRRPLHNMMVIGNCAALLGSRVG